MRDFYEVLGVAKDADADTIKKAYRKLAMQYHPDKNPGDKAAEDKFKEAASAYEVLSNSEKRAQYDRFGHQAFQGGQGGGGGFHDMDDIFSNFGDIFGDLFGGGQSQSRSQRRNHPRRGADLRYVTQVSLEDVVQGAEQEIEFDTEEHCKDCNGCGAEKGSHPETCGQCGGRGQVVRNQGFFSMASTCPVCQGSGQIVKNKCKPCRGAGRVKSHRRIRVTIPAGVDNGTRLRVSGEGEGGYLGAQSGDLYVEIRVKEDNRFEREGNDLISRVKLSYLQVLLGTEVEVPTVVGQEKLAVPQGTQPGEMLKLTGQGIPHIRGGRRGDMYFEVEVEIPTKINKEEEKLLRELAKIKGVSISDGSGSFFGRKK